MDKETAKREVEKLVEEFKEYSKEEINKKSENQIKSEFIDPLFEALGWDMRKDAEREERVLKKRADYILRIGNQDKLVVEAKKIKELVERMMELCEKKVEHQIKNVDYEIDEEIYNLYGITDKEKEIIERS